MQIFHDAVSFRKLSQSGLSPCLLISVYSLNRIPVSKHANLIFMCISCYDYAYQLRCTKQVILRALKKVFLLPPPLQNQPSMAVCNSAGIHAVCGCTINRALRTTKLLPKVVICIIITGYTYLSCERMF